MQFHQRGATLLGMLTIVAILGFALYGVIRLLPLYVEYMAVVRALERTADETKGESTGPEALRVALDRRWAIEDITSIEPRDVIIKKVGTGYSMRAFYRAEAPFIANVSLVAEFDTTATVR
jgi:hypothetical protein